MMIKKYLWLLLTVLVIGGCESLEDTYSEYAGDGTIRYQGKCSDVAVSPGWNKLNVTWKNNVDPTITHVKISWKNDTDTGRILVERGTTFCRFNTKNEGNYEVSVASMDKDGNSSLPITVFGRPYTAEHESVVSFTRLISKHYFLEDHLVLFFSQWDTHVESATLTLQLVGGGEKVLTLDSNLIKKEYILLGEKAEAGYNGKFDLTKPVVLHRTGRMEGCEDLITFAPYTLENNKLYTTEFKQLVETQFGYTGVYPAAFVEETTTLEMDHDINSLEDILNFPNLKKLILGKNRYLNPAVLSSYKGDSKLGDKKRSIFVLQVANKVRGVTVDRYNEHYFSMFDLKKPELSSIVTAFPNPTPDVVCMDPKLLTINCSVLTPDTKIENLIDEDAESFWQPLLASKPRTYEITIDMKAEKNIEGVKIVQKAFGRTVTFDKKLLPETMIIQLSTDGTDWSNATYIKDCKLGATNGEVSIVKFRDGGQTAKYLKITIVDRVATSDEFGIALADIGVIEKK